MKLLVYVIDSPHKKYWKFGIHNCSYFGTGVSSIFGHVTCPANFKRADYSLKKITSKFQAIISKNEAKCFDFRKSRLKFAHEV